MLFSFLGDIIDFFTDLFNPEGREKEVPEVNETPENPDMISEIDEARSDQLAEILNEVIDKEVIANWDNLSLFERADLINEYYARAGEALGIHNTKVIFEEIPSEPGIITNGYNNGDGSLHINIELLKDPSQLEQILETTTHEMRHQFQTEAVANPERFPDIPQDVLDTWNYEFHNYIDGSYSFEDYYNQAIECDARDFADKVVGKYTESLV